jgi:hypothetical protein
VRIAATPACGRVADELRLTAVDDLVDEGVRALSTYHTRPVVRRVGGGLEVGALGLLFYYQNRTAHLPPEAA